MVRGAVVIGDGSINSLGVLRSLKKANIESIIASSRSDGPALFIKNQEKYILPDPTTHALEYIEKLNDIGKKHDYVLIPTSDTSVEVVSKNKKQLEETYRVPVPNWKTLEKCVHKEKTIEIAKKLNIPCPTTYKLVNFQALEKMVKEITYPCVIKGTNKKERDSIPQKVVEIQNSFELEKVCMNLLLNNLHPIIQEKIPGSPKNLIALGSVFNNKSRPVSLFVVKKVRQIPFMYGVGTITESTWNNTVVEQATRFLREIKFYGVSHIEFKFDERDKKFKLIEINPRTWLHVILACYCGLNIPQILVDMAYGDQIMPMSYKKGIKWHYLMSDLALILHQLKSKSTYFHFEDILHSLEGPRVFASLYPEDFGPFFQDIRNHIRKTVSNI